MNNAKIVQNYLQTLFPDPKCELKFDSTYQLLIAVVLSAQCTDKRVNQVTETLFKVAPDVNSINNLDIQTLEQLIRPCGFYHNKAKSIKQLSKDILEKYDGNVPSNFDCLTALRGVGRKTANVVVSMAYGQPALAVDTHVFRVSHRLGLSDKSTADKCEEDLKKIFSQKDWSNLHYQMVLFGRYVCKAIKPNCKECQLKDVCCHFLQSSKKN